MIFTTLILIISISQAYEFSIGKFPDNSAEHGSDDPSKPKSTSLSSSSQRIESNMNEPVNIKKCILASKNHGYLSGEKARIYVEIKNNKKNILKKDISAIGIRELVDDDLGILSQTAKWKMTDSIEQISDIKLGLFRQESGQLENQELLANCSSRDKYYELFSIEKTINLTPYQKMRIIETLHDYFDVAWIIKSDVVFQNRSDELLIKNSKNNWISINLNNSDSAHLNLSDGRNYDLKVKELNGIKYIYDTNSIISFEAKDFPPKGYIIFFYDIMPKKSGRFNAETIIRLYDSNYQHLQDISFIIPIDVNESKPEFKVSPKPNKFVAICDVPLFQSKSDLIDIKYDIDYTGGSSEPLCRDVTIEFDAPNGEFYYVNEKGNKNDSIYKISSLGNYSAFNKGETKGILLHVVYPNEGIFSLPGVWINGVHHTFNEDEIVVESFWGKNLQYIFLFITIFALIMSSLEVYITRESLPLLNRPSLKHIILHFGFYLILLLIIIFLLIIYLSYIT